MKANKKAKNKEKNNIIKRTFQNIKNILVRKKEILKWILEIGAIVIALIALGLEVRVKRDTEELTKLSEKPIYYMIRLYPTEEMYEYTETEKHVRLNLQLVVDDFEIINEDMGNVNYNATFTHKKYYTLYDYKLNEIGNEYYYHVSKMDDKLESTLRLEDEFQYIFLLIYTETLWEQNLDLIFLEYIESDNGLNLKYEKNENGDVEIAKEIMDKDTYICKEYYIDQWSNGEISKKEDLEFMFDVYNDLAKKF